MSGSPRLSGSARPVTAAQKSAEGIVAGSPAKARTTDRVSRTATLMRTRRQNIQLELALEPVAKGEARTAHAPRTRTPGGPCRLTPSNRRVRTRTHGGVGGDEPRSSPLSRLRYGPAGDSAPRLRLGVLYDRKVPFRPVHTPPPFSLINSHPFGSARSRPGREAAQRTLDGEDRSGIIRDEGKGIQERGGRAGRGSPRRGLRRRPWRHSDS